MQAKKIFTFLKGIKKNNRRSWFIEHKEEYKNLHGEFKEFMQGVAQEVAKFDPVVKKALKNPKAVKVFRIYRDARFSRNKELYKTNFGGVILTGDTHQKAPCYYVHLEPGGSFIGGGIHRPEPDVLKSVRENIAKSSTKLRSILKASAFKKNFGKLAEWEMLKTVPRGFDKEHPAADLLRHKSFTAGLALKDNEVMSKELEKKIVTTFKALKPLNDYLAKALK